MSKVVLGKGLEALIPAQPEAESVESKTGNRLMQIAIIADDIGPNPMQPRQRFDDQKLVELTQSIKDNGILQPLIVRRVDNRYTIVAGERRFRAAFLAGMTHVPAVVMDDIPDSELLKLALIENIHREDLNAMELAEAYKRLMETNGMTQQEVADKVGKSRAAVANTLRLLTLPAEIQFLVRQGIISEGHARPILSLGTEDKMLEMARRIQDNKLTVRDTEVATTKVTKRRLKPKRNGAATAEMETWLKQTLGTSVRIMPGLKHGRIEIDYYGENDLDRLWELFRKIPQSQ